MQYMNAIPQITPSDRKRDVALAAGVRGVALMGLYVSTCVRVRERGFN